MSEIIKNIPNQVFRTNIPYLRWESNDLNIDLTPLVGKNIECAKGTFAAGHRQPVGETSMPWTPLSAMQAA